MKLILNLRILYFALIFYSCRPVKTIEVPLSLTDTLTRYFPVIFHSTYPIEPDTGQILTARKLGIDSFVVTRFLHRPSEFSYFAWKQGKKDSAYFKSTCEWYDGNDFDTANLPQLDAESIFLFGRKSNGTYVVIADQNNNNSFTDDSVFIIDQPINSNNKKGDKDSYPTVTISNLFRYYQGKTIRFSATVKLRPTVLFDPGSYKNSKLVLNFDSDENLIGYFKYKRKRYTLGVGNIDYPRISNKPNNFYIWYIDPKKYPPIPHSYSYDYRIGDTAIFGKKVFKLVSISPMLNTLTLQPLRLSYKHVPVKGNEHNNFNKKDNLLIGEAYPDFPKEIMESTGLNMTKSSPVLFINFWFQACAPCMKEMPALQKLYEQFDDKDKFRFISFTFEPSQVIDNLRNKYHLTFPIYSITREECERLSFGNAYPTNLVIGKNKKIAYYGTGGELEEKLVNEFFEQKLIPIIQKELY